MVEKISLNKLTDEFIQKSIETLRDDEHYYGDFGKQWFSNSDTKTLLEDPKSFGESSEDNLNFMRGRYVHQAILEPHKLKDWVLVDASTRNTKIYKAALEEHGADFLLLQKEADEAALWAATITSNMNFYDLIFADGNLFEEPAIGNVLGYPFKGKADIVAANVIYDIKTTGNIDDFKWNAKKYGYDSQAYIYEQLFGKPLIFLVVCKKTKRLGRFTPTEKFIASGKAKVERAMEVYEKFYGDEADFDIEEYFIEEELF